MESDDREVYYTLIFSLSGQGLVPSQIAKRLGVEPSSGRMEGQAAQSSVSTEGYCNYLFIGNHKHPLEEALRDFLALFQSREEELTKITHEFNAEISIKFTWNEGDYMVPSINFSHEILKKLCELNVALEVSTEIWYTDDGSWEDDSLDDDDDDFYRRKRQ